MEQEAERKAFARAWGYLSYNAAAKWAALAAAVLTGVLYVALLVVLWLFADLVVSQGRIPHFNELHPTEQALFAEAWGKQNRGYQALKDLDLGPHHFEKLTPEERLKKEQILTKPPREQEFLWRTYLYRVLRTDVASGTVAVQVLPSFRELPVAEQEKVLKAWRRYGEDPATDPRPGLLREAEFPPERFSDELNKADPAALTDSGREAIWYAYLWLTFRGTRADEPTGVEREVLEETLQRLRAFRETDGPVPGPDRALEDRGILSLLVRTDLHGRISSPAVAWLARWNGWWMWKQGNTRYLTGLLILGLIVGLLRSGASYLNHDMAARATIEAASRLRRAVYHHTFRLGTLAFKALGPSEAVSIFTRHVEAVHDALYAWLTVFFREPVKFGLVLAFALAVNYKLALVFLIFAALVWLIGGQVAAYFRRQGRAAAGQAAERLTLIRESLMLMRLVKVYLMELFNQSRVERQLARYAAAQRLRYRGEAIYRPLLFGLATLAALVLMYVGGLIVLAGHLGVASAITLAAALVSLYWPVQNFLEHHAIRRLSRCRDEERRLETAL